MDRCVICGKIIQGRAPQAKYCLDCVSKPKPKVKREGPKRCEYCGKEIIDRHSNNAKYCSEKCARNAETKKRMKYIASRNRRLQKNHKRERILTAYDFKCAVCGWQATDNCVVNGKAYISHGCEVHHITPVAEGGDESDNNLICLCPNCHKMVHMGLISRDELKEHLVDVEKANEEHSFRARSKCAEIVANAIFGVTKDEQTD